MKTLTWSDEQKAIFAEFKSGTRHVVVEAYAGTGKTATIKEAFNHSPERRMLYAVFNKRAQKEAEAKITGDRVDVRTLHSLGYMFIKNVWSNAKADNDIEYERAVQTCGPGDKEYIGMVVKLVSFVKNTCINPTEAEIIQIANERLQWDGESARVLAGACQKILAQSKVRDSHGRISFDDMVWLPVAMNWVKPRYELVVVDEAQDMNTPQLAMARQASSGRVIVVGDRRQAIYGFRGAATDGMGMMKTVLRATELKLTTTYRCPKAVVKEANSVVPEYRAADTALEGLVAPGSVSNAEVGDSILSRLNAPLMPIALQLIRAGKPARIEGRDIGRQLLSMVRTMKARSVPHFIERVEGWLAKQIERLGKQKKAEKRIEQADDIAQTLKAVAEGCKGVSEVEQRIQNLFEDTTAQSRPAIVLSSVHKAKGLEWPRVFLLTETFRRGKGTEEDNIYYVAVTRAMKELYLVGGKEIQLQKTVGIGQSAPGTIPGAVQISPAVEPSRLDASAPVPVAVIVSTQPATAGVTLDNYRTPTGLIYHQLGNVVKLVGTEHVCIGVNDCTAKFVPCGKVTRVIENRFDAEKNRTVEFTSNKQQNICSTTDPEFIIRVMPKKELQVFLDRVAGKSKEKTETGKQQTTEENSMKTKGKAVKSKSKTSDTLSTIVALAKSGKTEAAIVAGIKKANGGEISAAQTYLCGREWRRENDMLRKGGPIRSTKAAKTPSKPAKASKAPAKPSKAKATKAPARKLPQPPKLPVPAKPVSSTPPPRPGSDQTSE
jgi:superfamily I DNA/RNA helicase